jgi:hypothetical protein
MNKPNKQTIVPSRCVSSLMATLPLSKLRGFGGKLGHALSSEFNIKVAGDIIALGEAALSSKYDRSQCNWMLQAARGDLDDTVTPRTLPNIISCGKTFRGRTGLPVSGLSDGSVEKWLLALSSELVERLDEAREGYGRIPKLVGVAFSLQQLPSSVSGASGSGASGSGVSSETGGAPPLPSTTISADRNKASPSSKDRVEKTDVSLSKNSPMPIQTSCEGLAAHFLKLMLSAIDKSPKVNIGPMVGLGKGAVVPAAGTWKIISIFLHASSFDTIASEKQKISHFFSTARSSGKKPAANDVVSFSSGGKLHTASDIETLTVDSDTDLAQAIGRHDTPHNQPSYDTDTIADDDSSSMFESGVVANTLCASHWPVSMCTDIDKASDGSRAECLFDDGDVSGGECGARGDGTEDGRLVEREEDGTYTRILEQQEEEQQWSDIGRGPHVQEEAIGSVNSNGGDSAQLDRTRVETIDIEVLRALPRAMQVELLAYYKLDESVLITANSSTVANAMSRAVAVRGDGEESAGKRNHDDLMLSTGGTSRSPQGEGNSRNIR